MIVVSFSWVPRFWPFNLFLMVWPGAVTSATKRERVSEVLSWAGEHLAEDSLLWRAFAEGIAHPVEYYLVRMELQTGFIADFARRLKERPGI